MLSSRSIHLMANTRPLQRTVRQIAHATVLRPCDCPDFGAPRLRASAILQRRRRDRPTGDEPRARFERPGQRFYGAELRVPIPRPAVSGRASLQRTALLRPRHHWHLYARLDWSGRRRALRNDRRAQVWARPRLHRSRRQHGRRQRRLHQVKRAVWPPTYDDQRSPARAKPSTRTSARRPGTGRARLGGHCSFDQLHCPSHHNGAREHVELVQPLEVPARVGDVLDLGE